MTSTQDVTVKEFIPLKGAIFSKSGQSVKNVLSKEWWYMPRIFKKLNLLYHCKFKAGLVYKVKTYLKFKNRSEWLFNRKKKEEVNLQSIIKKNLKLLMGL